MKVQHLTDGREGVLATLLTEKRQEWQIKPSRSLLLRIAPDAISLWCLGL